LSSRLSNRLAVAAYQHRQCLIFIASRCDTGDARNRSDRALTSARDPLSGSWVRDCQRGTPSAPRRPATPADRSRTSLVREAGAIAPAQPRWPESVELPIRNCKSTATPDSADVSSGTLRPGSLTCVYEPCRGGRAGDREGP
jgi:hypothetical protein